jgi:hypothetical protein
MGPVLPADLAPVAVSPLYRLKVYAFRWELSATLDESPQMPPVEFPVFGGISLIFNIPYGPVYKNPRQPQVAPHGLSNP